MGAVILLRERLIRTNVFHYRLRTREIKDGAVDGIVDVFLSLMKRANPYLRVLNNSVRSDL